jgi:GMP synthase-like glutamine amidotransferase
MRSLIVRFKDMEGPGILEDLLRKKDYRITYHDAYKHDLEMVPESHQIFDVIVLLGGPQTVYDPAQEEFFKEYIELVQNAVVMPNKKIIGICLGSQIIAKALGAKVEKSPNGSEIGFGKVTVTDTSHKLFSGITSSQLETFHYHGDVFKLPQGAQRLLSGGDNFPNQMFTYQDKAFAIQCHFEITSTMLETWHKMDKTISAALGKLTPEIYAKQKESEAIGRLLFGNILG